MAKYRKSSVPTKSTLVMFRKTGQHCVKIEQKYIFWRHYSN